jgi:hypothetical protein
MNFQADAFPKNNGISLHYKGDPLPAGRAGSAGVLNSADFSLFVRSLPRLAGKFRAERAEIALFSVMPILYHAAPSSLGISRAVGS